MKKVICILGIINVIIIGTIFVFTNSSNEKLYASLDNNNLIEGYSDIEGNAYGVIDFALTSDDKVYVLDTARQEILLLENEDIKKTIDYKLDNLNVVDITLDENDVLYTLDRTQNLIAVYDEDNNVNKYFLKDFKLEAIIDFGAYNSEQLFFVIANTHGSETYIVELKDCTNEAEIINKISGRVLDEETVYKTLLVSEEGKDIGRSCIISIFDNLGDEIRTITISSEHWIGGAQYLGKIDGNDIVKLFEVETDINYNIIVQESLRILDENGREINVIYLNDQLIHVTNDIKLRNNKIVKLNNGFDQVTQIKQISPMKVSVVSKLDEVNVTK